MPLVYIKSGGGVSGQDIARLDQESGNERAANSVELQTGRSSPDQISNCERSVNIGYQCKVRDAPFPWSSPGIAIGYKAYASHYGIAMGGFAQIDEYSASSIAIGAFSSVDYKGQSDIKSIAIGYIARADGEKAIALGSQVDAYVSHAIAIGYEAMVSENSAYSISIGSQSTDYSPYSIAIGYKAMVSENSARATAIGYRVEVGRSPEGNVASPYSALIGAYSYVAGVKTVAFGSQLISSGDYGVTLGSYAYSKGNKNTIIGYRAYNYASGSSLPVTNGNTAIGYKCAAVGYGTAVGYATRGMSYSVALGYKTGAQDHTIAIGNKISCMSSNCIALGSNIEVYSNYSFHIGATPAIRKSVQNTNGNPLLDWPGAEANVMTGVVDATTTCYTSLSIPSSSRFFPTEVGAVATNVSNLTTQPYLSFGSASDSLEDILANFQTNALDQVYGCERKPSLNSYNGQSSIYCNVYTAADADALDIRFIVKGILIENE